MIRRFNYTHRQRIPLEHVWIRLHADGPSAAYFEGRINLDAMALPSEAPIVVEAYRQTEWMRFPWGRVGQIQPASNTRLSEFGDPNGVLFRVKVISTSGQRGCLLAEADWIRPRKSEDDDGRRRPLLPIVSEDLRGEAWRLETETDPILKLDIRLGDSIAVSRSAAFSALVYPQVIRTILRQVLAEGHEEDDLEGWQTDWLRFARSLPGVPDYHADNDAGGESWIDAVVRCFSVNHRLVENLVTAWTAEDT